MTIQELEAKLSQIPEKGAINIARRNAVLAMIYALMGEGT